MQHAHKAISAIIRTLTAIPARNPSLSEADLQIITLKHWSLLPFKGSGYCYDGFETEEKCTRSAKPERSLKPTVLLSSRWSRLSRVLSALHLLSLLPRCPSDSKTGFRHSRRCCLTLLLHIPLTLRFLLQIPVSESWAE